MRTERSPEFLSRFMTLTAKPARRLRVAHLSVSLTMGGAEKLLTEFGRHADRELFDLHFLSLGGEGVVAGEIADCGWPVTALNQPEGLRHGLVFHLGWLLRRWRADVLHTHNTKALFYGGPAARLAGVPAVVHTRHGQRFQASRLNTAVFRTLTRLADRVVCVSHDGAALSVAEGVAPIKVRTVWNGIDSGRFAYAGPRPGGPAVMVGRLSAEKDVATLIQAAALARQGFPGFRLRLAGEGKCMPELRRAAAGLGLDGSVDFLGEVYDVPGLLAESSLLVLPSLTEGISLTLLEAMARGLPVVATRVGGNPEVVADGETGFLVPAREPGRLAECMVRLLRDPVLSRAMGLRARQRVERDFEASRMVARYEALYRESLGTESRRLAAANGID
jgi:glycosyltransferase involved in cell wall biosynthesis